MYLLGGSLGRVRRPLGPESSDPELPTEILGLATEGEHWAALWRRGAGEDDRSRVHLTTEVSHHTIAALSEALVVEAMQYDGNEAELVVGFEMSRAHHIVLTPDSSEPRSAHALAPHEVPPAFAGRVRGALMLDGSGLHLARRDPAGDRVGEPVTIADGPVRVGALARRGSAFLATWLGPAGAVHARWVRCD